MTKEHRTLLWAAGGAWLFDAMDVGMQWMWGCYRL